MTSSTSVTPVVRFLCPCSRITTSATPSLAFVSRSPAIAWRRRVIRGQLPLLQIILPKMILSYLFAVPSPGFVSYRFAPLRLCATSFFPSNLCFGCGSGGSLYFVPRGSGGRPTPLNYFLLSRCRGRKWAVTIPGFIAKWRKVELKERSAAQEHFIDLCRLVGHPTPAEADPSGAEFCFEKGAAKHGGGNATILHR